MKGEPMVTRIVVTIEFDVRKGESPAQRADAVMAAVSLKLGDVVNRRTAEVKKIHRGAIWPAALGQNEQVA